MGLSRRQLGADEQIVVEVRRGSGRLAVPIAVAVLAAALAVAASVAADQPAQAHANWLRIVAEALAIAGVGGLVWLLGRTLAWRAETVAVTTDRVVLSRGVLRRRSDQVLLSRVVDAHVDRRLVQRLAGRGDLVLELADGQTVLVEGLRQPDAFQRVVLRQADPGDTGVSPIGRPDDEALRPARPLVVTEFDPTPPMGTPAVSAISSTADVIRLEEIDRLEAEGVLEHVEAERRRSEIHLGR